jgi:segregation and condensation protein A
MISRDRLEGVLNHLMFHKAIIYEEDRARKIDQYLDVLNKTEENDYFSFTDDTDRSFEVVFELVICNDLDPWDIDLMEFARLYAQRIENKEVDFIVAGKLLLLAWTILRRQSEEVLTFQERVDQDELFCVEWDMDSLDLFIEHQEPGYFDDFDPESVELCEVVRHKERRPVMLVELLDAFEEARKEAKIKLERALMRAQVQEEIFDEKAHQEELEKDVEEVWARILRCGSGPITIEDISNGAKDDLIMVLVSLLFLTRMGKISIWQEDLPHGKIFFEVKMPWDIGTLEDVTEAKIEVVDDKAVM